MTATTVAAKQDIAVHLDTGEGPMLMGDHRRLMQVLDNLIGNAVKFSHQGGLVRVTARWSYRESRSSSRGQGSSGQGSSDHGHEGAADGGTWRIAVSDSGIGIPPGEAERLFERFERGSNARAAGLPGSGLGRSIVKVITEMHGGHVRVHSVHGAGTTFSVFLPVRGPAAGAGP